MYREIVTVHYENNSNPTISSPDEIYGCLTLNKFVHIITTTTATFTRTIFIVTNYG